jgi:hypothetical protein
MSVPNEETCPVPLSFLADLMRAKGIVIDDLIQAVGHPIRSQLAMFCYRRAHLRQLALTIALHCSRDELGDVALMAGDALYLASRQSSPAAIRPKISLAGAQAA